MYACICSFVHRCFVSYIYIYIYTHMHIYVICYTKQASEVQRLLEEANRQLAHADVARVGTERSLLTVQHFTRTHTHTHALSFTHAYSLSLSLPLFLPLSLSFPLSLSLSLSLSHTRGWARSARSPRCLPPPITILRSVPRVGHLWRIIQEFFQELTFGPLPRTMQ